MKHKNKKQNVRVMFVAGQNRITEECCENIYI